MDIVGVRDVEVACMADENNPNTPTPTPGEEYAVFHKLPDRGAESQKDAELLSHFGIRVTPPTEVSIPEFTGYPDPDAPPKDPAQATTTDPNAGNPPPTEPNTPPASTTPDPTPAQAPREPKKIDRLNPDELADKVADKLRAALEKTGDETPAPAATTTETTEEQDEDALVQREAVAMLSKSKKYAGRDLVKEYDDYAKKERDRIAAWQKEHPGQEYDSDAAEHSEWYQQNIPDIDESAIEMAKTAVVARRQATEVLREEKQAQRIAEVNAIADDTAAVVEQQVLGFSGHDVASLDALREKDRVAWVIAKQKIAEIRDLAATAVRVLTPGMPVDTSDKKAKAVLDHVAHYENAAKQAVAAGQDVVVNGKKFVTATEYEKMSPAQRQSVWTFRHSPEVFMPLLANHYKTLLKRDWEEAGGKPPSSTPSAAPAKPATPAVTVNPPPPTQKIPSSGGAGPSGVQSPEIPDFKFV